MGSNSNCCTWSIAEHQPVAVMTAMPPASLLQSFLFLIVSVSVTISIVIAVAIAITV